MGKVFQPKVIIGSVCGIIASIVGFIAIFFPSLFNLETKKIDELNIVLQNPNDALKLKEFLKKHENLIVNLKLNYTPLVEMVSTDESNPSKPEDCMGQKPLKTSSFTIYYEFPYYDDLPPFTPALKIYSEERDSNMLFGDSYNFGVESKLHFRPWKQSMENGSFCFILNGTNKSIPIGSIVHEHNGEAYKVEYLQKNDVVIDNNIKNIDLFVEKYFLDEGAIYNITEKSFILSIPYPSNKQTLYKWQCDTDKDNPVATLEGIFLVHPQKKASEVQIDKPYAYVPALRGRYKVDFPYGTAGPEVDAVFIIEPMDPKDIKIRQY